jgi:hypothetical protein
MAQTATSVCILSFPQGAGSPVPQLAQMPLMVPYEGRIENTRRIYVRVFRDSLHDLTVTYPRGVRAGQCVLYTHSNRFPVFHSGDGQLLINDIVDFFENGGRDQQILTLVFEEGEDADSNKPLKLSRDGVQQYFGNAVQLTLRATEKQIAAWKAREEKREAMPLVVANSAQPQEKHIWNIFKLPAVNAATTTSVMPPPPPSPAAAPAVSSFVAGPCEKVVVLPFTPLHFSENARSNPEAFSPVAIRDSHACGE